MSDGVRVVWTSIRRKLHELGDGVFLVMQATGVKGSPEDLITDVETALALANTALRKPDLDELTRAQPIAMGTPKGVFVDLDRVESDEDTQRWLDVFADELAARGRSGKVTAAPQAFEPNELRASMRGPTLATYVAYTTIAEGPGEEPSRAWGVPTAVAERVCRFATEWAPLTDPLIYLGLSTANITPEDTDISGVMVDYLQRRSLMGLLYASKSYDSYTETSFSSRGAVVHSSYQPRGSWRERLEQARQALLLQPEAQDLGFVRHQVWPRSWQADNFNPRPPKLTLPSFLNYSRWALPLYTPDAHGLQVLTGDHLDKANDLSQWVKTALGEGRYLVESRHPEAWFAEYPIQEEVLTAARTDFGEMILSDEVLRTDPRGWLSGTYTADPTIPIPYF